MQNYAIEGFQLSPQQKHLCLLQKDSFAYRAQYAICIEGKLDTKVLKEAFHKVVNSHEILRTNFIKRPGVKIPIQVIVKSSTILCNNIDLSDLSIEEQSARIEQAFQAEKQFSYNFEQGSLLRLSLLTLSETQYILLITLPSLCTDSWSLKNLVQEISDGYAVYLKGEELSNEPVQYIQFSEWQNELLEEEDAETGRAYWHQQNFWSIPALNLPFESKFNEQTKFSPDVHTLIIDSDLVAKLEAIAPLHNTTIAEFLLACWQTLFYRILRRSDIIISTVYSGRKYEELHTAMGLFAKWLPTNCTFQDDFKFSEILSHNSEALRNNHKWQEYFIWEESTETAVNVVNFPISFEFEEWPAKFCAGGVLFSPYKQYICFDRFKVKLSCVRTEDSLRAEFHYDANLFSVEDIEYLAEQFQTLVESAANNAEATVSELEILSDRQRQQLLVEVNNTQTDYPQDKCIHQLFEEQVEQTPNNIAVVFEDQQLTYRQLNTRANKLAHYLQALGVGPEVLVGICVERSLNTIIAMLGILKAGGAYVPLDPALPKDALAFRLQDVQAPILLTQHSLIETLPNTSVQVLCLDTDWQANVQKSDTNPTSEVTSENLIYVIFTSGSTGQPKGVAVEHWQLVNYLHGILQKLNLQNGVNFATVSTFAADLGNTAIFPALSTGGCLHIISQERASDPEALAEYFQRHPIDCLKIVPSHLTALLASSPEKSILPRQCLILGGEALSWNLIETIQRQKPNCQILNHYGPTETTVGVLTYLVELSTKSQIQNLKSSTVPLGHPLANTQIYVLDERLRPVPIGIPGELYIGGAGLTRGYLNRPELTAEKFITNPFSQKHGARLYKTGDKVRYLDDKNLEFIGRVDDQVKIRGFRIELGEIEVTLQQHSAVQEVVVLATEEALDGKSLVAYIVLTSKFQVLRQNLHSTLISELRSFCLQKLPEYMIPSVFVFLKALPLTANGKVNRQALPAPEHTRPELEQLYVAPRTLIEKQLAEIWTTILDLEQVGIHDSFFDLGGHSLLVTQLLAKVRKAFQVELPLRNFFDTPTIANLAKTIEKKQKVDLSVHATSVKLNAEAVLDPAIHPPTVPIEHQSEPRSILLTGATGFLGAFLLSELLQQTPDSDIYCLVRAQTAADAKQRLQDSLETYLLWNDSFAKRIVPVVGDLSQPLLGLSDEEFRLLASQIDLIYHNGALVNFTYPYSALKAANVLGTQEVLRLATQIKVKPVHFISTIGVAAAVSSGLHIREQDNPEHWKAIANGYTQSKWVSEKLVTIARERGVPVSIYRPGRISGHSQTGVCNVNDHTFRMIRGCIQLGSVPNHDTMVNLIPVDYMSKAIVHLSQQKSSLGKVFHILNPQPLHWSEFVKCIQSFGYPLRQIPYEEWQEELINATLMSTDNALYPLIAIFSESKSAEQTTTEDSTTYQYDCQNTITGFSITCPPLDSKLLSTYFLYLIRSGFLDKQ
ncbi:amino acid adenylation domain-containing protein [Dendronalium sp. ChiSLP03b]|uniref:non-ribosomal peptide synthetase family protein n=1 Tax=Dendronalium sp. ChiSLP03b TaxID=3075381 RepID=UPI002AD44EAD|nr:amino acid adenylation domain-containing protein [Dendronalium sp. ChiSLP03b]MDZ8206607.1 amino acid adenylation domain-containing protein [Dendronalium sp. ChiSLP03b]